MKKLEKTTAFTENKKNYKLISFKLDEHRPFIEPGRIVKFQYSVLESLNPTTLVGKIFKVHDKGVEVFNELNGGQHAVEWHMIRKIFLEKDAVRMKQSRLKVLTNQNCDNDMIAYIDGAIEKLIYKVKAKHSDISIEDSKVDQTTRYRRTTKFKYNQDWVEIDVPNEYATKIEIRTSENLRKSSVKCIKNKININLIFNKIQKLKEENEIQ